MKELIFSIGWDVGGWLSSNNAFCLALAVDGKPAWISQAVGVKARDLRLLRDLDKLVAHIVDNQPSGGPELPVLLKDLSVYAAGIRTVIAIDAPLGFSREYQQLVTQSSGYPSEPMIEDFPESNFHTPPKKSQFLQNVFGFRETERFVEREFGKRPLSAPFDFLGNNASLAINARLVWEKQGFRSHPFTPFNPKTNKSIIEVYPGLFKGTGEALAKKLRRIEAKFLSIWPGESRASLGFSYYLEKKNRDAPQARKMTKTDECDSVICAVLGLGLWLNDPICSLETEIPEAYHDIIRTEGWIYTPQF